MIKVGLIGAGFIGRNHFNQYDKLKDKAKVVAICDLEEDRRTGDWSKVGGNVADTRGTKRDIGGATPLEDWHELVADPRVDLVDVCVPTYLHAEMAVAALRAGKHVLCEKPMALTVEDCDRMLEAAASAKGSFMIAQCLRFWPECVYLKGVIADKRFGELKALNLRRQASTPDYSLHNWILDPKLSGGAILDLHVHDVDLALWLLGKPASVVAQAYARNNGAYDRVHALWNYPSKVVTQIEGYWDMPPGFGFNCGFTAVSDGAAVVWDLSSGKPLTVYREGRQPETPEMPPNDGYFNEIEYFLGCVARGEQPTTSTPAESRLAVAIALAEKQSAIAGGVVTAV